MSTAQSVPQHLGERREPLTGETVDADRRELWYEIGNGKDLSQR
jgi:hypothetical protein